MRQTITDGSRLVRMTGNDGGGYRSTLFLNHGETITNLTKTAKTLAGAEKQAARMLKDAA